MRERIDRRPSKFADELMTGSILLKCFFLRSPGLIICHFYIYNTKWHRTRSTLLDLASPSHFPTALIDITSCGRANNPKAGNYGRPVNRDANRCLVRN